MRPSEPKSTGWTSIRAKGRGALLIVCILLALAVIGSIFLAWVSLQNGPVAGCGEGSGCNKVMQSRWAYWLGMPVSIPAVLAYLSLLVIALRLLHDRPIQPQRLLWGCAWILSVMISLAAVWFIGLQALVIHAFCKFCLTVHACALLASAILLARAWAAQTPHGQALEPKASLTSVSECGISRSAILGWTLAGIVGVAGLIAGQVFVEKRQYVVASSTPTVPRTSSSIVNQDYVAPAGSNQAYMAAMAARYQLKTPASNAAQSMTPLVRRTGARDIDVHGGTFHFHLDELPMIGSSDAPHIILSIYDYSCHQCRELHPRLVEAQNQLSNQIAFLLLPTPLNSNCNPVVKVSLKEHSNACEYARLALGVWRAKPDAFRSYDDWLFKPAKLVPVAEARRYAEQLVGVENLDRAMADAWIGNLIRTNGFLYKTNYLLFKKGTLPELMMGTVTTFGSIPRVSDLLNLLSQQLELSGSLDGEPK